MQVSHFFDTASGAYKGFIGDESAPDRPGQTKVVGGTIPSGTPGSAVALVNGAVVVDSDHRDAEVLVEQLQAQSKILMALLPVLYGLVIKLADGSSSISQQEQVFVNLMRDELQAAIPKSSFTPGEARNLIKRLG